MSHVELVQPRARLVVSALILPDETVWTDALSAEERFEVEFAAPFIFEPGAF